MAIAPPYPLFLDLVQRPVLIVGGGKVALRKAQGLIESAARVTVVSPVFEPGFDALTDVERLAAPYAATHMARKPWRLVFAATNVREVNVHVQKHAIAAGILCCRCDDPEDGDFANGAVERLTGGVTVAVSTSGASPGVSVRICRQAAEAIDPVLPKLVNLLALWRTQAKRDVPDAAVRRMLLQRLAGEEMEAKLRKEGEKGAAALFEKWIGEARAGTMPVVMAKSGRGGGEGWAMASEQAFQLSLLGATSLCFGVAFALGLGNMRRVSRAVADAPAGLPHEASMGTPARAAVVVGTVLGIGLFAWRMLSAGSFAQGVALPVSDPFDAFLVLGLLLAFVLMYFRWTRHLRSLSFFLLPMIVVVLLLGAVLSVLHPVAAERQDYRNIWTLVHVITIVAGSVCFALGCVGGIVYLLAERQIRRKGMTTAHRWIGLPPLASIEKFNQWMIYVGFPLLTISTVAGILRIALVSGGGESHGGFSQAFKIGCGGLAWAVYAVLLHVPLNPRFRGSRAAWLSIAGFALFIGAYVAAKWN